MKVIKIKTDHVVNNFLDSETGEVIDTSEEVKHHKIVVDDKESFVFLYTSTLGLIDNLDKCSIKVLLWCGLNASHNTNIVHLSRPMCDIITKEHNLSYQTIKNSITKLVKADILIRMGTNSATYRVNPRYFWKGQSSERLKTMKYILEIECPNC